MSGCIAAVVLSGLMAASAPSVQWEADYGKALKQTRAEDARPLLVVLDMPGDKAQSLEPALIDGKAASATRLALLSRYELCRIDASTQYGKEVARVFKAESFPFVAVIDRTGSVILHQSSGAIDGQAWNTLLAEHLDGVQPVRQVVAKPVVSSDVVFQGSGSGELNPVESYPAQSVGPMPSYGEPVLQSKPFCPSCQRRGY